MCTNNMFSDEQVNLRREVQQSSCEIIAHPRHHRPSLIDLLTGANQSSGNVTPGHRGN